MRIIPAIDIIEGKCVRLSKGDYSTQKMYNENPLEVAKSFEAHGITHLHLVDLDGAKSQHIVNYKVLEELASKTSLHIDFGGGLKSDEDLKISFNSGAQQITGGSIAVKDRPTFLKWLKRYGAEKIILGADAMNEKIAVSGWQEGSDIELVPFIREYRQRGIKYVICTDINKDGMLQGPSVDLYQKILEDKANEETAIDSNRISEAGSNDLSLIASGGVTTMDDIVTLRDLGCEGAILGKAIYENKINLKELEAFILNI
ncbi:1-(5-phosphoribosyl)-5-[(5-phosphoribosylamino)methylideneamino]imidazole-4-carboxamide isomerase [Muriicola soli]|uniref:1-(5-phosphoribosyl)-5-[(5-phosphoribosylamino)methylideneamino] imidazole-4-carboxamide isomerase n=1 Tax=Muriicola soli TaxID=2507538 RepID=A0A411E9J4_9FLAO|nr:1-(5-phosphoribosyl)-5-[(5-phosphoribosylamino)methylideneamino]imidazole-4-carboxamide isomerase [Muriicola soli]QBA64213.1 1-(5-phosphoribosyl)-5-[(5-phosphoribosylamino)methylideneamino]imidazole-4-carboxamide isomerase [Muriicola soli]